MLRKRMVCAVVVLLLSSGMDGRERERGYRGEAEDESAD